MLKLGAMPLTPIQEITVEIDREDDGRFIADVVEYPGVMTYGKNREDACDRAIRLLMHVLVEEAEHASEADRARFMETVRSLFDVKVADVG